MESNNATIGRGSCVGQFSCRMNRAPIGAQSCNHEGAEKGSCELNKAPVGVNSCNGEMACYNNTGVIGDNSCNGPFACANNRAGESAFFVHASVLPYNMMYYFIFLGG